MVATMLHQNNDQGRRTETNALAGATLPKAPASDGVEFFKEVGMFKSFLNSMARIFSRENHKELQDLKDRLTVLNARSESDEKRLNDELNACEERSSGIADKVRALVALQKHPSTTPDKKRVCEIRLNLLANDYKSAKTQLEQTHTFLQGVSFVKNWTDCCLHILNVPDYLLQGKKGAVGAQAKVEGVANQAHDGIKGWSILQGRLQRVQGKEEVIVKHGAGQHSDAVNEMLSELFPSESIDGGTPTTIGSLGQQSSNPVNSHTKHPRAASL